MVWVTRLVAAVLRFRLRSGVLPSCMGGWARVVCCLPSSLDVNSVLGKWGFGFCNWGLTFGLGLGDGLCNSTTRGTFSCPIFEQNILLEIS